MPALRKYLNHYCESEVSQLANFDQGFQQGLVIPVYRESSENLQRFIHFAEQQPGTLLVIVVNRPEHDQDIDWTQPYWHPELPRSWHSDNQQIQLYQLAAGSGLMLIDRFSEQRAISKDQGVGLARKVGADVLLALIANKQLHSPWIANTDADAQLPGNYFQALASQQAAAVVYPYRHINHDPRLDLLPTLLYEFSLHYYVEGLRWAGSTYGYHTIGSTITVHAHHYAQVRGFPKRAGAEDFYLLNKLAKTGAISSLDAPYIELQARESDRVPFGTGPAVSALRQQALHLDMPLYHPQSFVYLRHWLQQLQHYCQQTEHSSFSDFCLQQRKPYTASVIAAGKALGVEQALQHCFKQGKTPAQRQRQLTTWLDGFRSLKAIHFWRDNELGLINYQQWQDQHRRESPFAQQLATQTQRIDQHLASNRCVLGG